MLQLPQPGSFSSFPSAFAAFASQLQSPHFQNADYAMPRKRVGGSTMKTAKVWRFFDELPTPEQAAECRLCRKKIKATNSRLRGWELGEFCATQVDSSDWGFGMLLERAKVVTSQVDFNSTTGMIRHLRSCHVQEYQQVQEARQSTLILKMEEKARAQLLREMNTQVASTMVAHINKKTSPEPQKSPSASSSASDTASSVASSLFGPALPPLTPLAIAPAGLPAPKPVKIFTQPMAVKQEATEVEDDVHEPTDLSAKTTSAFAALNQKKRGDEIENEADLKTTTNASTPSRHFTLRNVDERKINAQIAMMMLIDQIPSKIVDGHGFRSLMSFLLPEYPMPSAELFESTICPEVITQIQPHLANLFSANNPHCDPFDSLMQVLKKRQADADDCHNVSFDGNASKSSKRDEDSDSSCSVEVENALSSQIDVFVDYVRRFSFPKDELHSLLTVCHSVFGYFEDRPTLMAELSLTTPTLEPSQPSLLRDVLFVAEHADRINAYIRATPDMALLPISDAQSQTLTELVRLVRKI
ncbi:unnamed protein product [Heligmosomoides polygyrus]|uniref:BED-type domain-containing protein n=1 Tax=Heligmosomoides polygyrus TaxID=6339 RepID=A0A3P8ASN3_HELPZ|nr:unnamed protein product [Heligmosomoides polygyrus]